MSDKSAIEWTDATWTIVTGCTKTSPACANCYIERSVPFRVAGRRFVKGHIPVQLHENRLNWPLKWKKPKRIFVTSLGDLFHEDVPDEFLDKVFAVMALTPHHTYQVLTKQAERMHAYITGAARQNIALEALGMCLEAEFTKPKARLGDGVMIGEDDGLAVWPLPNVWLGCTVENQTFAHRRLPLLLDTPAAKRFLSCEPLLGPLDLTRIVPPGLEVKHPHDPAISINAFTSLVSGMDEYLPGRPQINWVIGGGESASRNPERYLVEPCTAVIHQFCDDVAESPSDDPRRPSCGGTGWRPKPHALDWATSLRDQCVDAGVPFFWKQWGGPKPKSGGRLLDGREWNEMPQLAVSA